MNDDEKTRPRRTVGDMKQGLTGSRPKMSILPRVPMVHAVRAIEYGADKYARGNYHGPAPAGVSPEDRLLGYVDATIRHLTRVADAINRAKGTGGDVRAACSTRDEDGGGKFPASSLPDLSHALASMMIGVSCAADDGLLVEDPGQPWKNQLPAEVAIPQKSDPAAERARVASLRPAVTEDIRASQCISTAPPSFGRNQMPPEMVPALMSNTTCCAGHGPAWSTACVGGLAADLTPGEADLAYAAYAEHLADAPSDGVPTFTQAEIEGTTHG